MASETATDQREKNSFSKNNLPAEIRDNLDKETLDKLEDGELEVRRKEVKIDAKRMTVEEENGTYYLTVPVSGLADDRDGDDFSNDGLERTVEQLASEKVPFYFDHGLSKETGWVEYSVLDMRGKWVDGYQKKDQVFGKVKLRNDKFVEDEIEEFVSLHKQEMPVGYSVGFIPTDYEEKETGGITVHDHDLLEVSGVGIPSQPDSVTQSAGMAIAKGLQDSGMDLNEKEFDEEKIIEGVKSAMTSKEEKDADTENKNEKSVETETKQVSPDEVDAVMEIINIHNEAMKGDIRTYMEENDLIEEESEQEETEEDGEYGDDEDEETDSEHDEDEDMNQEDASDQTEESEKDSAESEQEEEKGLSEDEKTDKNNSQSENKINTVEDEDKDSTTDEQKSDLNDPFKITEQSKA